MEASSAKVTHCRVCGCRFRPDPLLRYSDMPAKAQYLPGLDDLALDRGTELTVCQCAGCGLVQIDSRPVSYYREVVRAAAFSDEMREFRLRQFADWIRDHRLQGKKVLEVGCGKGEYLSLLSDLGPRVFGLEHSPAAVRHCHETGLLVERGFIGSPSARLRHGPFDAFVMLNFLEHLPKPVETLRGIANNLVQGAVGLVEVPNLDMIIHDGLFAEFMSDHLSYFTRDTLVFALEASGFSVLDCRPAWHDYILSATISKRDALDLSHFKDRQGMLTATMRSYLERFPAGNVAVWGAGHQALALLHLLAMPGCIKYVVDSAPFKQGRYTPVTHLPIVPPERLLTDPVAAVVVMAASYSDEVARTLRTRYGGSLAVAIVRDHGLEEL